MIIVDLEKIVKKLQDAGLHVDNVTPIERGHRIFLKEGGFIDIVFSEIIFYYRKKINCEFLDLYRKGIKSNIDEILRRGYLAGLDIDTDSCYLIIVKKIKETFLDNLWNEYLNMMKISGLILKTPS